MSLPSGAGADLAATAAFLPIGELQAAFAARTIDSETLVRTLLDRIERHDARLHAFVDVYGDEALGCAAALDRMRDAGLRLGPLHGVPVAIKDLFDIEGRPTTGGSQAQPARAPRHTATVVERLRRAGAIVMGKTHTVEFAFGGWGTNAVMGTPWNPWDAQVHRAPGGSSSGSAVAVAGGLACAALGTDTGGSVRIPAGMCNLVGIKTSPGLVSRHGLMELCPTHDTVGPLARTVSDAALLLDVIAGADVRDASTAGAAVPQASAALGRSIAGLRAWTLPAPEREGVEPAVLSAYDEALRVLGALGLQSVHRELPLSTHESMAVAGELMSAEGYANLGTLAERADLRFDPHVRRRILAGSSISLTRYLALLRVRAQAQARMAEAMDGVDFCVFPTNAVSAPPVAKVDEYGTPLARFGRFVNLLGLCSVAVPAGFSSEGMPVSIQFIGRCGGEALVLRAAHAYQTATDWHRRLPPGLH